MKNVLPSPILFAKNPQKYARWSFNTRSKLLLKYTSLPLKQPGVNYKTIRNHIQDIIDKACLPFDAEKYLSWFQDQQCLIPLGGKVIQLDLKVLIAINNFLKQKGSTGKKYYSLFCVMWAYYVAMITNGSQHSNSVILHSKALIYTITGLNEHTILDAEKTLSSWGLLHKQHSRSLAFGEMKTTIKFSIDLDLLLTSLVENHKIPKNDAVMPVIKQTKRPRRHQKFIKQQLGHQPIVRWMKTVSTFELFSRRRDSIQLQAEFTNPWLIMKALWSEDTLKTLLGIRSVSAKSIYKKANDWLDNRLPYYPNHNHNQSELSKLKASIRPNLKKIAKTGITINLQAAFDELDSRRQQRDAFISEHTFPTSSIYEEYTKARGIKKKKLLEDNPEISNQKQLRRTDYMIQAIERLIEEAKHSKDGRIHPKFRFGQNTNRVLTYDANIQGLPKELRHLFPSPPKKRYMRLDIKQQDLTILTLLSGDTKGQQMLKNKEDIYIKIADSIGLKRKDVKIAVNAYIHGSNGCRIDSTLTAYLKGMKNVQSFHTWMDDNLPQVVGFRSEAAKYAKDTGTTFPTPKNYSCQIYDQKWNKKKRSWDTITPGTKAKGYPIQATSAELMMLIIYYLSLKLPKGIKIVAPVHDEIILELTHGMEKQGEHLFSKALREAEKELFNKSGILGYEVNISHTLKKSETETGADELSQAPATNQMLGAGRGSVRMMGKSGEQHSESSTSSGEGGSSARYCAKLTGVKSAHPIFIRGGGSLARGRLSPEAEAKPKTLKHSEGSEGSQTFGADEEFGSTNRRGVQAREQSRTQWARHAHRPGRPRREPRSRRVSIICYFRAMTICISCIYNTLHDTKYAKGLQLQIRGKASRGPPRAKTHNHN